MRSLISAAVLITTSSGIADAGGRGYRGHGHRHIDWIIPTGPQVIIAPEMSETEWAYDRARRLEWQARCKPPSVDGRVAYAAPGCDLQILN